MSMLSNVCYLIMLQHVLAVRYGITISTSVIKELHRHVDYL